MPSLVIMGQVQIFMDSTFYGCFVMLFTVSTVVLNLRDRTLRVQLGKRPDLGKDGVTRAQRNEIRFWLALGSIMLMLTTIVS